MRTTKKKRKSPTKAQAAKVQRTTPAFVTPMAAQVVKRLPEGDDWIYELKFDGYRALTIKDEQRGELLVGLLGLRPPSGSRHAAT